MLALRAALAAATSRAALALHTTLHSQLEEAFRPSDGSDDLAAEKEQQVGVPAAAPTDLEDRRRELELLHDTESGAAALIKQHRFPKESLWLSGKSRQAMTNYHDTQYFGFMKVGGQTIAGIFDTGSFDLVVFSDACKTCGQAAKYSPALSASHTRGKLTSRQSYGSGTVVTQEAFDIVSVGPYEPKNQSFWEVTDAHMPLLAASMFQAIIGLGPPEAPLVHAEGRLAKIHDTISNYTDAGVSLPSDLVKAEANMRGVAMAMQTNTVMLETFESTMFSICLGRQPNSNGYLIWGDTAPLVRPEYFRRLSVSGNHTWSLTLDEPKFAYDPAAKGKQFDRDNQYEGLSLGCENGCGALLDSGSSILAIPGTTINKLIRLTQEPGFNCSNMWELPSIKIKLGGQQVILPPDAYISEVASSAEVPEHLQSFVRLRHLQDLGPAGAPKGRRDLGLLGLRRGAGSQRPGFSCDIVVMESGASTVHGPLWILGVPFFRQYYTTFEVSGRSNAGRAVHIAKASDTCHPASPEAPRIPPRTALYKRRVDPAKLWVTPSAYSALSSDYVFL